MNEYNFLNLSSFEFENFSRDILQEKFDVFFESFTSGQDGGIDLRATVSKEENIIVQAKRYTKYSDLKSTLKTELKSVKTLNPDRYIITTSVGLTPPNKNEILKMFHPYIKSTEDIFGKNDLNNLLGLYPKVEERYYKLWLSSTNILKRLVHSTVYNQSKFELEEIRETLKIYVQNNSFKEALDILKSNNYVIISGIPGIGKTTLSRMLVYRLLAKEYDDFIYVSESINDAYSFYEDGKKQIFFFDDFLGRNFLETGLSMNEDSKLIKFIEKIKKTKNKIFILATREYILNQAKNSFESLNNPSLELVKCTLDLSKYTKIIKAEILYNHLFFANVPKSHLKNLVANKSYSKLIEHKSYNPRIIETFVQNQFWDNCEPNDFSKTILSFFDNPTSVWLHAFENTISKGSQITLLVLSTIGTPVLLEDLRIAINSFVIANIKKYPLTIDSIEFKKIIKELESTFISTKMDSSKKIAVEFQNPSIQDFLINYIKDKEVLIGDLINSFCFVSQFFRVFTFDKSKSEFNRRIPLDDKLLEQYVNKIISDFHLFKSSYIYRANFQNSNRFGWFRNDDFKYSFLIQILEELEKSSNKKLHDFVIEEFKQIIEPQLTGYSERKAYLKLLNKIDRKDINISKVDLVNSFADQVNSIESLKDFSKLKELFSEEYEEFIANPNFENIIEEVVEYEIQSTEVNQYENLIDELKELENDFGFNLDNDINDLSEKHAEFMHEFDQKMEKEDDYSHEAREYEEEMYKEEEFISNLFDGLADE
ncbi:nSTAND3 domain-containing NTPase [Psychroflexus aestuariivivens]|uniref:nSTAND3 domain-containing NTPase n=1 Tax=Psychroflexus aestuariivivens TaxID=1795040 RepID=UPI000FD9E52A|nr:restriction endonuclease [Psychroflexus aestuariivivens]